MFDHLKPYRKIIVTGPQRSGTRIAARMIAHDLGHQYVDENDIDYNGLTKLFSLLLSEDQVVVQCPKLSAYCHMIDSPNTAVVFMIRDCVSILKSEKRIDWQGEQEELIRYFADKGPISLIKYKVWGLYQKPVMKVHYYELHYESLRGHPLWVENREGFGWNQTRSTPKHKLF